MAQFGINVLSTHEGHDDQSLVIDDSDPEQRKKLAEKVIQLLHEGFSIFVGEGGKPARKVVGYDPDKNEWLVKAESGKRPERVAPDKAGKPTAVAPIAGG